MKKIGIVTKKNFINIRNKIEVYLYIINIQSL